MKDYITTWIKAVRSPDMLFKAVGTPAQTSPGRWSQLLNAKVALLKCGGRPWTSRPYTHPKIQRQGDKFLAVMVKTPEVGSPQTSVPIALKSEEPSGTRRPAGRDTPCLSTWWFIWESSFDRRKTWKNGTLEPVMQLRVSENSDVLWAHHGPPAPQPSLPSPSPPAQPHASSRLPSKGQQAWTALDHQG